MQSFWWLDDAKTNCTCHLKTKPSALTDLAVRNHFALNERLLLGRKYSVRKVSTEEEEDSENSPPR